MGIKFYRGSDKSIKFIKRWENTRSWFRSFKWVTYHSHPTFVPGHPFKGGQHFSTGILNNPEIKRFNIGTAVLLVPPHPNKNPYSPTQTSGAQFASFGDFFQSYFGSSSYKLNDTCQKIMGNMK